MTHIPVLKRFEALATNWKRDEFSSTRLTLTIIYAGTVSIILGVFSYLLYAALVNGVVNSFEGNFPTEIAQQVAIHQVIDILKTRLLIADGVLLFVVIVVVFFLTTLTLYPLKKARERERRFLADAAHELRTPLTIMKTDTEVLLRNKSSTPSDMKELLKKNIDEIDVLTNIANGLLDLMHTRDKEKNNLAIEIDTVLTSVVEKFTPLAHVHGISLISSIDPESKGQKVYGRKEDLERIFTNGVENAIKYTKSGGKISIILERKGSELHTKITDTGCGIAPKDLPFVTEPFYRADSARAVVDGSGLGLAIMKETIEACGGKLKIESVLNEGTTVHISLPRA